MKIPAIISFTMMALALTTTGCAGKFDLVPTRPHIPARLQADEAETLYQQNRISCDDGKCQRADGAYSVEKMAEGAYASAKQVVDKHRRTKKAVFWSTFGASIGTAAVGMLFLGVAQSQRSAADSIDSANKAVVGAGLSPHSGSAEKRASAATNDTVGLSLLLGGAGMGLVSTIINLAYPSADKEFEEEYNSQLKQDIRRRLVAPTPAVSRALAPRRDDEPRSARAE